MVFRKKKVQSGARFGAEVAGGLLEGRIAKQGDAVNLYPNREAWLQAAAAELTQDFAAVSYRVPERLRYAIGFPSTGRFGKRIGECWTAEHSADRTCEIFIRGDLEKPVDVLGILTHELVDAAVGTDAKHGKIFRRCALAIGLTGPMRSTAPGPVLAQRLCEIADTLGPLPHAALLWSDRKKQSTRLIKVACGECGYTARVPRKWLEEAGPPLCPQHGAMVIVGDV